jgi:hypothetical protein
LSFGVFYPVLVVCFIKKNLAILSIPTTIVRNFVHFWHNQRFLGSKKLSALSLKCEELAFTFLSCTDGKPVAKVGQGSNLKKNMFLRAAVCCGGRRNCRAERKSRFASRCELFMDC